MPSRIPIRNPDLLGPKTVFESGPKKAIRKVVETLGLDQLDISDFSNPISAPAAFLKRVPKRVVNKIFDRLEGGFLKDPSRADEFLSRNLPGNKSQSFAKQDMEGFTNALKNFRQGPTNLNRLGVEGFQDPGALEFIQDQLRRELPIDQKTLPMFRGTGNENELALLLQERAKVGAGEAPSFAPSSRAKSFSLDPQSAREFTMERFDPAEGSLLTADVPFDAVLAPGVRREAELVIDSTKIPTGSMKRKPFKQIREEMADAVRNPAFDDIGSVPPNVSTSTGAAPSKNFTDIQKLIEESLNISDLADEAIKEAKFQGTDPLAALEFMAAAGNWSNAKVKNVLAALIDKISPK